MTEAFDFAAAVADARRDYPEETRDVTFLDLSSPDAAEQLMAWHRKTTNGKRDLKRIVQSDLACRAFSYPRGEAGESLVAMYSITPTKPVVHGLIVPPYRDCDEARYIFEHELGHIVVPNGISQISSIGGKNESNEAETAADCFAVMRCFQLQKMTVGQLAQLSSQRAMGAMGWDGEHLTSFALDQLVEDCAMIDFAALLPQDIKNRAQKYAEDFSAHKAEIETVDQKLRWRFGTDEDALKQEWLENLTDVCMSSTPGSFGFYVSAKILADVLNHGKIRVENAIWEHERSFNVASGRWDAVRRDLARRAQQAGSPRIRINPPGQS